MKGVLQELFCLSALILGGCDGAAASGGLAEGVLGVVNVPQTKPTYRLESGAEAARLAYEAGSRGYLVGFTWRDLEPSPGTFALDALEQEVAYAKALGFTVLLNLQVVNTSARETPDDLQTLAFDEAPVQARFRALLDALAGTLEDVTYLAVGNEVDGYLGASGTWETYTRFYADAVTYVHETFPGLSVGTTVSAGALSEGVRSQAEVLIVQGDVAVFTYYPVDDNFQIIDADAEVVLEDMLSFAGDKRVLVQEFGYPTSPLNGGSEVGQAAFIGAGIAAWRGFADKIPFFSVFALHDLPPVLCEELSGYYGLPGNRAFEAFLCSLGLRKDDGTPKSSWQVFTENAEGP